MESRISREFAQLKRDKRKALIAYLTAGFPTKASFETLVRLLEKSGVDMLEIGIPFSDPIADGPTIQYASQVALAQGGTMAWALESARRLRQGGVRIPFVVMSYVNPIQAMGAELFFKKARACGIDGVIIPDMIPEEAAPYQAAARRHGIDFIFLVAPTTPAKRQGTIAKATRGFLYAVSLTGVTGTRTRLPAELPAFLRGLKRKSRAPVAVGFGISTPRLAKTVAKHSDGIIVGSALLSAIQRSQAHHFDDARRFIQSLRHALDS